MEWSNISGYYDEAYQAFGINGLTDALPEVTP